MKKFIRKYFLPIIMLKAYFIQIYNTYIKVRNKSIYGYLSSNTIIEAPILLTNPQLVYFDTCKIRRGLDLINNKGKFIVKKYSTISLNCTVVTGNHRPTVGVPHIILGSCHINEMESDIIIEEDVWVGVNCTLLAGTHIGRGAIIGACSMINKEIPPYAVAVGSPAKIIASVFTIDQIIEHEKVIYPESERFKKEYLKEIFEKNYVDKKSMGFDNLSSEDKGKIELRKRKFEISY